MDRSDYERIKPTIPSDPGVYRWYAPDGEILYVGKAKNLINRVSSYFVGGQSRSYKTRILVRTAAHLDFTIVNSEHDALLLENALIKEHQPRYNVMLRDDKTYAYICVKKERFPRVFFTRKLIKDGSTYYGPFTSKHKANIVFQLIKKLYPIRTCSLNLSKANIEKNKFKVCLEYHIGNCLGPCVNKESEEDYNEKISQIKSMLKGRLSKVKGDIKQSMITAAENLDYEKAQQEKIKLEAITDFYSKSTVFSTDNFDCDVFSIVDKDKFAYINYLKIIEGRIVHTYNAELTKNLDTELKDLLAYAMFDIRTSFGSESSTCIIPFEITEENEEINYIVPQRGDKKKLLDLSHQNALFYANQKEKSRALKKYKTPAERILNTLKKDLNMEEVAIHIECFDNSNLGGSQPVASCVVFKNAKPSKKDYRHFNIKTVIGANDFASMEEIVYRRYKRLVEEKESLPQLVIIDGGKGQLSSAMNSINKLGLSDKITVIGIAKRLEEIFFPEDPIPIYIDKRSESLKLMQYLRNEAHRFAINFHRDKRSKAFIKSELTEINGIGTKTAQSLLKAFGSVKKVKAASFAELSDVVGNAKAKVIREYVGER